MQKGFGRQYFLHLTDLILSFDWRESEAGVVYFRLLQGNESTPPSNKLGNLQNCIVTLIIMITKLNPSFSLDKIYDFEFMTDLLKLMRRDLSEVLIRSSACLIRGSEACANHSPYPSCQDYQESLRDTRSRALFLHPVNNTIQSLNKIWDSKHFSSLE